MPSRPDDSAPPPARASGTASRAAGAPDTGSADAESGAPDAYRRRPRQSRGQKRVELLLDAAATVIAEQGLGAAT
ncbi:MAG: hypothetical protein ACK6DL_06620, partial [Gemmatimonas sp.]